MSSSPELSSLAKKVEVDDSLLVVTLTNGQKVEMPVSRFPRLLAGTKTERANWELIGRGTGIHWPDLDEDIEVQALLAGQGSGESQASIKKWLLGRSSGEASKPE